MLVYIVYFLDRSNIGNARILNSDRGHSLVQTLHLSNRQYLSVLVIYLVAYALFEIPSNHILKKVFPSRYLSIITACWGITTIIQSQVTDFRALAGLRFVTGAFEAGLFPGITYILTFWYKPQERTSRLAWISASTSLGGAFGGTLAYAVGLMDGTRSMEAWRWLFIFEGTLTVAAAVLIFFTFPDYPETTRWFSASERELIRSRLDGHSSLGLEPISWSKTLAALSDWRLYLHYFVWQWTGAPYSSFSLFTPTVVSGLGFTGLKAQLMTAPPFATAFVTVLFFSYLADKTKAWSLLIIMCSVIAAAAFIVEGSLPADAFTARYGVLFVALPFMYSTLPLILTYMTVNIHDTSTMTIAISLNNAISFSGALIGLFIYKEREAPAYPTGHFVNAAAMLACAAGTLLLRVIYSRRNARLGVQLWYA